MNRKFMVLSVLAVFVTLTALHWVLHAIVLAELYEITKVVWRPSLSQGVFDPLLFVTHFWVSVVFVLLFVRGYRNKGWPEGVRYGLLFGFVVASSVAVEKFVMLDIPVQLGLGWFLGALFYYMIMGVVAALVYRLPTNR